MAAVKLEYLEPVLLRLEDGDTKIALVRRLRKAIGDNASDRDLKRSVYIVRLAGRAAVAYDADRVSPTVYIGRGDSVARLASHLKSWASNAFTWGHDISLEIRIVQPDPDDDVDCFKYLEADLLRWFHEHYAMLPLINSRFETRYENQANYTDADERRLMRMLKVGSGKRPHWAIYPLKSNPHFERYYKNY